MACNFTGSTSAKQTYVTFPGIIKWKDSKYLKYGWMLRMWYIFQLVKHFISLHHFNTYVCKTNGLLCRSHTNDWSKLKLCGSTWPSCNCIREYAWRVELCNIKMLYFTRCIIRQCLSSMHDHKVLRWLLTLFYIGMLQNFQKKIPCF